MTKAQVVSLREGDIPPELRKLAQWVCWQAGPPDERGKFDKVPVDVHSGRLASTTDPATWSTFDEALAYYQAHGGQVAGLGFVFAEGGGLVGVDVDDCLVGDQLDELGQEFTDTLHTYWERSPSGRGIKAIAQADIVLERNRRGRVEVYNAGRFFTLTGHRLPSAPASVQYVNGELQQLVAKHLAPPKKDNGRALELTQSVEVHTDGDVVEACRQVYGSRFDALYRAGDLAAYGNDASAGDLALANMLAYVTQDPAQLERIMNGSALGMRDKWQDRQDYRDRTIDRAIGDLAKVYTWPGSVEATPAPTPAKSPEAEKSDDLQHIARLADFAPWVNKKLNKRTARANKIAVSETIVRWLLKNGRLLLDEASQRPYVLTESGETAPIDGDSTRLRVYLTESGINPTEATFKWLCADLEVVAHREGRRMRLARYMSNDGEYLYISNGRTSFVRVDPEHGMWLERNGAHGIYFAGDAVLPPWDHTARPVDPLSLPSLSPILVTPHEVPAYTPDVQRRLLSVWLTAMVAGVRPLPLLSGIGGRGGGKTTLVRGAMKLLLGPDSDVTPITQDQKDFVTATTQLPIFGLDNLDSGEMPKWLPDSLAIVVTGANHKVRKYYTTSELLEMPATAAMAVTSRTAVFARADIAERMLPFFTGDLDDNDRIGDNDLAANVNRNRNGCMVYMAQRAANLAYMSKKAPQGLPLRFVDFARMVWADSDDADEAVEALKALRAAQALSIGDADPLLAAILEYAPADGLVRLKAAELVKDLANRGADIPFQGGGKAIARKLRELRSPLIMAGWRLHEDKAEQPLFTITRIRERLTI